jgi:hypothetical protein
MNLPSSVARGFPALAQMINYDESCLNFQHWGKVVVSQPVSSQRGLDIDISLPH